MRFQPKSVPGAHLSPLAPAVFAQLAPDRSASVTRSGGTLTVTVRGPGYKHGLASVVEAIVQRSSTPAAGDPSRPPLPETEGGVGWVDVGEPVPTPTTTLSFAWDAPDVPGPATWTGTLAAPVLGQYRVLIRGYEQFYEGFEENSDFIGRRLAYADAVPMP